MGICKAGFIGTLHIEFGSRTPNTPLLLLNSETRNIVLTLNLIRQAAALSDVLILIQLVSDEIGYDSVTTIVTSILHQNGFWLCDYIHR